MSETIPCPDCGHRNPPGSTSCSACHFPLTEDLAHGPPPPLPAAADVPPVARDTGETTASPAAGLPPFRPRPRRPRPQGHVALSLWLGVGSFLALLLVLIAVQANLARENPPVEGSSREQQERANALRAALDQDSTDTAARVGLADVLFDTGNWSEAIVHYRAAVRRDSSLVTAIVDLGVCYYNLGVPHEAERLFLLALARDPHQPFALFNLGIVHERRGDPDAALQFFHRALQSAPPDNMKPALMEAMQRVAKQTGKQAPPLDTPR